MGPAGLAGVSVGPGLLRRREVGPAGFGPIAGLLRRIVHLRGDLALELLHTPLRRGSRRLGAGLLKVRRRLSHRRRAQDIGRRRLLRRIADVVPPERRGGSLRLGPWRGPRRRWLAHVASERLQQPAFRRCERRRCGRPRRCAAIAASSRQGGSSGRSGGRRRRGRATIAASAAQAASASVSAAEAASVAATAEESRSGRGDVAEVEVDGRRVAREGDDLVAGHGRCGRLLALMDDGELCRWVSRLLSRCQP